MELKRYINVQLSSFPGTGVKKINALSGKASKFDIYSCKLGKLGEIGVTFLGE